MITPVQAGQRPHEPLAGHVLQIRVAQQHLAPRLDSQPQRFEQCARFGSAAIERVATYRGHWMAWMQQRSGELKPTPRKLGSRKYPPGVPAPGEYVLAP